MPRRSPIDDLFNLPWWVPLVLAGCVYGLLNLVVPSIHFANPFVATIASNAPGMSKPIVTILIGIALLCAIRSYVRRHRSHAVHAAQISITSVRALPWDDFERLMAHAFRLEGYRVKENQTKGADNGIDLWLSKDSNTFLVQCKHWQANKVSVATVRELLGVVAAEDANGGIIVCSGTFTKPAVAFAGKNRIRLIGGNELAAVLKRQLPGFAVQIPGTNVPATAPICPHCGGDMVERTARSGSNAGSRFLGCLAFPKCRGTLSL